MSCPISLPSLTCVLQTDRCGYHSLLLLLLLLWGIVYTLLLLLLLLLLYVHIVYIVRGRDGVLEVRHVDPW
jgi:hypothetical protein